MLAGVTALVLGLTGCQTGTGDAPTSPSPRVHSRTADPPPSPARTTHAPGRATTPAPDAVGADRSQRSRVPALSVLDVLPVKGRAPKTGYTRDRFGPSWTDDNDDPGGHNGCDTRNDILRRDLDDGVLKPGTNGCVLLSGTLRDPYTARAIGFRRGDSSSSAVQIDHVVALSDAWQTGAQQLTDGQRVDLANDPLELLAVDGPTNEQKGDGDAATWLPPNKSYRCAYVARQLAVKQAYHLWLTPAEAAAIGRVLSRCPTQTVPREAGAPHVEITPPDGSAPSTSAAPPASTSAAPPVACTTTSSGSCIRGGESCPRDSYGHTGHDGEGRAYVCKGSDTYPHWEIP